MFNDYNEIILFVKDNKHEEVDMVPGDSKSRGGYKIYCPVCQSDESGEKLNLFAYVTNTGKLGLKCDCRCEYKEIVKALDTKRNEMYAGEPDDIDESEMVEVEMLMENDTVKPLDTTAIETIAKTTTPSSEKVEEEKEVLTFGLFWTHGKKSGYKIQGDKLMEWLNKQGYGLYFYTSIDGKSKEEIFVKVVDNVISHSSDNEIGRDVSEWINYNFPKLKSYICKNGNSLLNKMALKRHIKTFKEKFHRDSKNTVYLYYKNGVLEVTKSSCKMIKYTDLDGCIWEQSLVNRDYVENKESGEFEKFFMNINNNDLDRYNKMLTSFGYLISRFKDAANGRAIIYNDEDLENQQGGAGKGIILRAVGKIRRVQSPDMRERVQNQFIFQNLNPESDIIHLEDVAEDFKFEKIFNVITGDFEMESKGTNRISIPFEISPKIAISTNYAIKGVGNSVNRRKAEYELFKHYNPGFTPADEFGHRLFDDWTPEEWNKFDSWVIKAVQHFLNVGLLEGENKVTAIKKVMLETSETFINFMNEWSETMELKKPYPKHKFYSDYLEATDDDTKLSTKIMVNKWRKKWGIFKGLKYFEKQKEVNKINQHVFWYE